MIPEEKRRVAYINEMIESGHAKELVAEGENYHAEQLAHIAREIIDRGARIVLIAGPSSSGKTSTVINYAWSYWRKASSRLLCRWTTGI